MGIIRKTQSLDKLLAEFNNASSAISVIELIKRLDSQMNKTTIYRVLDKLEDDGILHSFLDKNGIKWYAKCSGCSKAEHMDIHPHFECLDCGKIDCITLDLQLPKIPGREVFNSHVLIQGRCENCLK
jgi:Fur family transcriptional regulator, ferric uptake regulator